MAPPHDYSVQSFALLSKKTDSIKPHSVRRAVILSLIPGAGQIYNHRAMPKGKKKAYWKVPLIYAGLGASTYLLIFNQTEQIRFKNEYSNRQNGGSTDFNLSGYDDAGILTLYNQYLNWRDLSILAVSAVYILQLVDAGVEAHFVTFDVSEDLSLGLDPVLMDYRTAGLRMTLNFR
jgi:Family of unknown function (DUF5683)